jgi:hypothetical protein
MGLLENQTPSLSPFGFLSVKISFKPMGLYVFHKAHHEN